MCAECRDISNMKVIQPLFTVRELHPNHCIEGIMPVAIPRWYLSGLSHNRLVIPRVMLELLCFNKLRYTSFSLTRKSFCQLI